MGCADAAPLIVCSVGSAIVTFWVQESTRLALLVSGEHHNFRQHAVPGAALLPAETCTNNLQTKAAKVFEGLGPKNGSFAVCSNYIPADALSDLPLCFDGNCACCQRQKGLIVDAAAVTADCSKRATARATTPLQLAADC